MILFFVFSSINLPTKYGNLSNSLTTLDLVVEPPKNNIFLLFFLYIIDGFKYPFKSVDNLLLFGKFIVIFGDSSF